MAITNHSDANHLRTKPRLIQVSSKQLTEPSDLHVVNMIEGGEASHSNVTDADEFVSRNLQMDFRDLNEKCNSIRASTQPPVSDNIPRSGTHNTRPNTSHNRHSNGAPQLSSVPTLPPSSDTYSQLSGKISATHQINQLENKINTKYLTYKEPHTIKQALKAPDSDRWKTVMEKELQQLDDLQTMKPVEIHDIPKDIN